jgi:hypothetical protein
MWFIELDESLVEWNGRGNIGKARGNIDLLWEEIEKNGYGEEKAD